MIGNRLRFPHRRLHSRRMTPQCFLAASWYVCASSFLVHVHTGDKKGAGTNAQVYIQLRDKAGNMTTPHLLDRLSHDDHQRSMVSSFLLPKNRWLRDIDSIVLFRNTAGQGDSWFLDLVEVVNQRTEQKWVFPVHRWVHGYTEYRLRQYDISLPQQDDPDMLARRQRELASKLVLYEYSQYIRDGPVQIKVLPEDERFSEKYQFDFGKEKKDLMLKTASIGTTNDKWSSFSEMMEVVKNILGATDAMPHWKKDKWFGVQRLQGVNPVLITLCTSIPEKLGVNAAMVEPFLEDFTLDEAIRNKQMFIVDLQVMEGIPSVEGTQLCAPIALFYLNKNDELMPVAIQLFQNKGSDIPVFLPSDPPNLWLLAKMFYNNAEAQHHESLTHLGFTHLMMEGVVICTHRNLSPSHPLFRLLAPHFLFLLNINAVALRDLIAPGAWVDRVMTVGTDGMRELISRSLLSWRLDTDGVTPRQVASRGVDDPRVLPHYPYRDDACALYAAIERYVRAVVESAYSEPGSVQADPELQQWRQELTRPRHEGGVGMLGVAGGDQKEFSSTDEVVEVVTAVIAICSQGHAAANFGQYDEYGFVPNYPLFLNGSAPTTKDVEPSDAELMGRLPGRFTTREIMILTKLLSYRGTNSLGDFEVRYLYDPVGSRAVEELRVELRELTKKIAKRNAEAEFRYRWLDPVMVPNAISV